MDLPSRSQPLNLFRFGYRLFLFFRRRPPRCRSDFEHLYNTTALRKKTDIQKLKSFQEDITKLTYIAIPRKCVECVLIQLRESHALVSILVYLILVVKQRKGQYL